MYTLDITHIKYLYLKPLKSFNPERTRNELVRKKFSSFSALWGVQSCILQQLHRKLGFPGHRSLWTVVALRQGRQTVLVQR